RPLDNSLTAAQQAAREAYFNSSDECAKCHPLDRAQGTVGSDLRMALIDPATQFMKTPAFENLYQKIGLGVALDPHQGSGTGVAGEQVRGFGLDSDGTVGLPTKGVLEMMDFLLAIGTNLAPIVGQQVTLSAANAAVAAPRIDLLMARAEAG